MKEINSKPAIQPGSICLSSTWGEKEAAAETNFIHVAEIDIVPEEKSHHSGAYNSLLNILHPDL